MFLTTETQTDLTGYITKAFNRYSDTLLTLSQQHWKDEDIRGTSKVQYTIEQYYMAILLVVLVRLDVDRLLHLDKEWSEFETTWGLAEYKERFACVGISLDNILSDFGLPLIEEEFDLATDGIETMGIELSFEIQPDSVVPTVSPLIGTVIEETIDFNNELLTLQGCDELTCSL